MPHRMTRPHPTPEKASVTAAEIIRNFGYWQQCALEAPLAVTHHGRARVVLISAEQYEALAAGERAGPVTSDAEARRLMEHAIEGFIIYDAELRLVHVNKVARDYFGTHLDNMLMKAPGDPSRQSIHPEIEQALRDVHLTRGSRELEIDSIMFPERRIRLRLFPYGDGVALAFLNISETQRMKAGAARMTSLRRAVQALGKVGVVRLDAREVVLFADHIVTELTGFTNADLKNQRLINFVVPERPRLGRSDASAAG